MKPWQERVAMHHINGDPRDNRSDNVRFVHIATCAALTDAEIDEYRRYLMRQRQAFDPITGEPAS